MFRKNCSDMVLRVLREGFGGGWVWHRYGAITTPKQVKRLVLDLGAKPVRWDAFIDELHATWKLSDNTRRALLTYRRRDSTRGSTQGPARFGKGGDKTENDYKNLEKILEEESSPKKAKFISQNPTISLLGDQMNSVLATLFDELNVS